MAVAPGGYVISASKDLLALTDLPNQPNNTVLGNVSGGSAPPTPLTTVQLAALLSLFGGGLSPIPNNTVLGNISGVPALPAALTQIQLTSLLNLFSAALKGLVPPSGGSVLNVLRGDVSWGPLVVPYFPMLPPTSALSSGSATASSITLTYTVDTVADGVVVFYRPTGSGPDNWTLFFAGAAGGSIVVTGLLPSTEYDFLLCPWNGQGQNGPGKSLSAVSTSAGSIVGIKPWDFIAAAERPRSTRVDPGFIDQSPAIFPMPPTLVPFLGWETVAAAEKPKATQAPSGHVDYPLFAPPIPPLPSRGWETVVADRPNSTRAQQGHIDVPLFNPPLPVPPGRGWETTAATEKPKTTQAQQGHIDYELWKVPQGPPGRGWESVFSADKPKNTKAQSGWIDSPLIPQLPPVGFFPQGETFSGGLVSVLLLDIAGSTIYYTTDGSTPTTSSTVFSGSVNITTTTTLKAFATAPGYLNAPVVTQVYTAAPAGAFVQANDTLAVGSASSVSIAYTSNVTAGDILVAIGEGYPTSGTLSISDTQGNTWTLVGSVSNNDSLYMWVANANATGANTVTISIGGGGTTYVQGIVAEYSGYATSSPIDSYSTNSGSGSGSGSLTLSTGSIAVGGSGELIVSAYIFPNPFSGATAGSGFTMRKSLTSIFTGFFLEDNLNASSATNAQMSLTQTGGGTAPWAGIGVSIKS